MGGGLGDWWVVGMPRDSSGAGWLRWENVGHAQLRSSGDTWIFHIPHGNAMLFV